MRVRKRLRTLRRLAYLGGLVGTVVARRRAKARRDARVSLGPPGSWPPLQPAEPPVAAVGDIVTSARSTTGDRQVAAPATEPVVSDDPVAAVGDVVTDGPRWVVPDAGGSCPSSHPVKANGGSRIYHPPGGQFYERTRAARCYADAAAAEADGYRAAKGS